MLLQQQQYQVGVVDLGVERQLLDQWHGHLSPLVASTELQLHICLASRQLLLVASLHTFFFEQC